MRHKLQEGPKANISMMPSGSLTLRCCFLFHDQDTGGIPLNSKKELTGWELWVWSLCSAKQQVEGGTAWCCTYHVTKLTKGPTQTMQLLIPVRYLHLHRYQTGKKNAVIVPGADLRWAEWGHRLPLSFFVSMDKCCIRWSYKVFYTSRPPPIFLARSTPALFRRHVLSVIVELSMLLCWSITTRWGNNVIVPLLTLPKSLIASMMYNHSATPGLLTINAFFSMWGNQGLRQLYVEDELLVPKVGMLRMKAWLVMAGIEATCRHAAVWWRWQICLYAGIGSDVSIARSPGSIRR